ncbi:DUF3299 domain-containing protein [Gemmatimonas sp.]|jgi:hypothetical protein|uniref:DUF3299 domain-containing protein n=1 Tax=Gemmatimonas sp. TaxID=1962908 RepID=UPI0031C3BBDB|nr:DUF3299 domain-containing protein [Gemmatimonas sp.]
MTGRLKRDHRVWSWLVMVVVAGMCSVRPARVPDAVAASPTSLPPSGTVPTQLVANTASPTDVITIDWKILRTLDFRTGKASDTLRFLEKRRVRLPGFIVPLEDFQERAKEFLLVPYFGACVHLPPPPPNQMIYVTMNRDTKISWWNPVWIEGAIEVINYKSVYGIAGYRMRVDRVTQYEDNGKWP